MSFFLSEGEIAVKDQLQILGGVSLTCSICKNILVEPKQCSKCQNLFCGKCIDEWLKSNKECPSKCSGASIADCTIISKILNQLTFNCRNGCGTVFKYEEAAKHYSEACPKLSKNLTDMKELLAKIEILEKENLGLKTENYCLKKEIENLKSKKYFF